jgi:hypothetical protein
MKTTVLPAIALLALAGAALGGGGPTGKLSPVPLGIGSGGGKSSIDSETLWSSIGSPFATGQAAVGGEYIFSGQIEVVYARANPTDADIDGDGIPDFWGRYYFGTPRLSAQGDDDGDGDSNLLEFLAGNDPLSPISSYRTQQTYSDGTFTLDFPTMTGRSYRIWWSADLKASWALHETHQGNGHQGRSAFTPAVHDPLHASRTGAPKYFFRVEILKP